MNNVWITKTGMRYHARPDCEWITGPHKSAVTNGWTVHQPQEVALTEDIRKMGECGLCFNPKA
ncbi:hypothetical protein [Streptomyces sp. NPDC002758]